MNIKPINKLLALAMMVIGTLSGLTACGDDDDDDNGGGTTPAASLTLRSQSIQNGAEVEAESTTVLTLTYNTVVSISASANITLNGSKVTAKSNATTSMAVDIPLTLEEGQSYTLTVPEGSFVSKNDAKVVNTALTITFTTKAAPQPIDNTATGVTKRLGWGWNLGNHFDTSSGEDGKPYQWGFWDNATPTATLYTNLKKAGVSTVRICVTWGNYQTADTWTIDADYMATVKQNVDWAEAAGLNVILNMHHDEYWQDIKQAASNNIVNDQVKARIEATWKQIAETFKDEGDYLFFESFNEV